MALSTLDFISVRSCVRTEAMIRRRVGNGRGPRWLRSDASFLSASACLAEPPRTPHRASQLPCRPGTAIAQASSHRGRRAASPCAALPSRRRRRPSIGRPSHHATRPCGPVALRTSAEPKHLPPHLTAAGTAASQPGPSDRLYSLVQLIYSLISSCRSHLIVAYFIIPIWV